MRSLLLVIYILFSFSLFAQMENKKGKWAASLTGAIVPLPAFNFGVQPGIEYKLNDRFSLLTEITIRLGNKADVDSEAVNKQYFRVQPELRYSLNSNRNKRRDYIGFRASYATRKFADVNSGFYAIKHPGDNGFYYNRAKINSPVITSSIQYGTIIADKKKISVDAFAGLGVRMIHTEYTDVTNPIPGVRSRPADGPGFYSSYSYLGNLIWFHMNAGFRLYWQFRK